MMRWLLYVALAVTLGIGLAAPGLAAIGSGSNSNPVIAAKWCYNMVNGSSSTTASGSPIISPLIQCFTDTNQGIIPSVTIAFLNKIQKDYVPLVTIMMILAIAYYGARIMLGDVQRLKASTFILGLKMGGILLFLDNAPLIYTYMVGILQQLSFSISSAATSAHNTGFCIGGGFSGSSANDNSQWQQGLWGRWDCIFRYLLGFSTKGFAAASIASFLFLMIFSASTGLVVFFMGLSLILSLFTAAFRFIHIYLMSFLALSFMFCVGYLFVPLLLFRNTFDFFRKWLTMIFGFILTPVMMFGFMGMMLVAVDIAIFSGPYSVFCAIGGTSYCGSNTASGAVLFSNLTAVIAPSGTDPTKTNVNLTDAFTNLMYVALNNPQSMVNSGGFNAVTGLCASRKIGFNGAQCDMGISGSAYEASGHYETQQFGFDQTAFNLTTLASGAGSTCTTTYMVNSGGSGYKPVWYFNNCPYLEGILVSLCVALLLVYIMGSLLQYIPSLASSITADIVNQNIASFGAGAVKSQIFGEGGAKGLLSVGNSTAQGAVQGFQKGGVEGAASGGAAKGFRALDMLLMGDR